MSLRPVKRLVKAKPTMEGAGVHLRRAFGFGNTTEFDPFLLLDDFRNVVGEPSFIAQNDHASLPGSKAKDIPEITDDDGTASLLPSR